jgi:cell shape-determining protein MreC
MKYQFRDKNKIKRNQIFLRFFVVSVVVIIFFATGLVSFTRSAVYIIGRPVWKFKNAISTAVTESPVVRTKKSVLNENINLLNKIKEQDLRMMDYDILKKENEDLKNILNRKPVDVSFVLGYVLSKPNQSPYDTLIIDVGSLSGVKEGDRVFADGIIPIGYVSYVYKDSSLVSLYTGPGEKIEGMIDGSNTSVILNGRGGGNFEVSLPMDLETQKGTLVTMPHSSNQIVAIIGDTISKPTDPLKKVLLSSPVNMQGLRYVQVRIK